MLLRDLVEAVALIVEEVDDKVLAGADLEETSRGLGGDVRLGDDGIGVGALGVAGFDAEAGVFIVEGADGELLVTGGVNAVVLPMAVATDRHEVFNTVDL